MCSNSGDTVFDMAMWYGYPYHPPRITLSQGNGMIIDVECKMNTKVSLYVDIM